MLCALPSPVMELDAVRRTAWIGAQAVQVLGDTYGVPTKAELRRMSRTFL